MYTTLNPLSPLVRNHTHLAWPVPSPFVRTYYVDDPYVKVIDDDIYNRKI